MANTLKILYWIRKNKANREGLAPLIVRISYLNTRVERSTGHYIKPAEWNVTRQRVKGENDSAIRINTWINHASSKLNDLFRDAIQKQDVHLPSLLNLLFTKPAEDPTLLRVLKEHNVSLLQRVGHDFTFSTYEKYVFTYNKVKAFIESQYHKKDVFLRELSTRFIIEFDHYLRVENNNQHNTAVKYCLNLKKVINSCVLKGLLSNNPFRNYKTVYKDTPQVYLDAHEVNLIENARYSKPNHLLTRDLFLFQCYTGLAYTDLISLNNDEISNDNNNRNWIIKRRQKSGIVATIPLLPRAKDLLEKYQTVQHTKSGIFPYYSIQKYNQYLGEIGDLIGLSKKLSSHVGRRTFGNLALSRGISINVISKILGHSNTLITQRIYAITTQNIISNEIMKWESK
jgi:integrase